MTSREFIYWLQGYFEIGDIGNAGTTGLSREQVECVKKHLGLVFTHEIDPSYGNEGHQEELNQIHNPFGPNSDVKIRC